jgi:AraC-like DNA-binding protein
MSVYPEKGRLIPAHIEALYAGSVEVVGRVDRTKTVGQTIIAQVLQGRYQVSIPRERATIEPGDVCIIPSQTPVTFIHLPDSDTGLMKSRWAHIRATLFGVVDISSLLTVPLKIRGTPAQHLGDLIQECILQRPKPESLAKSIRLHHLGHGILNQLALLSNIQPGLEDRLAGLMQLEPTLSLIKENLHKPIDIQQVARWAHLSPSRLHTVFVDRLGHAPMSYVRVMRIREAQKLLASTDHPIAEIARKSGFACQFHFARCFKKTIGLTPTRYRENAAHEM